MTPTLTAVLCTWDRVELLEGALEALVAQQDPPSHEILVVDNASPDRTREVVERFAADHPQVRYVLEPRQGLAYARNTARKRANGTYLAFTDDDVRVAPDWMASICRSFERWPDAACIGGPVLPRWFEPIPAWLTRDQWAPLGVQDYGAEPLRVDERRPLCLIGANLAFRRGALDAIGDFNAALQRVGNGGGSTEDHELHLRMWAAGLHGMYDPSVKATALLVPERLRKAHHRSWHFGHGRHVARMRIPEMEASEIGAILGVPAHLVRQAGADAWGWLKSKATGDSARAFAREVHLWFIAGFSRERV
jgi:glucosyl-dolichyl phosphate glucuronosyltransferase